ncbi:CDP-alcohol phosphatidyltransferase family protein [Vallitalea okinawensis]|uniref:CDP-alcohol phosphatidyltransferase family protein n=1 Tax=Vallitalea okinawensis TaxID=2078660 RepID=UPI000CFD6677|nr:CDP-alcohol phosphatidyltransferase family protein [Vallitalea okinawensis]
MLVGFYNYTVILTYFSLFISIVGIYFAIYGNLKYALIALMLSGFCDMFDGKIAATRKRTDDEKRFGVQIDSLCDLICFGVFPAIICFQITGKSFHFMIVSSIYVLAGLIRLAYFNIMVENNSLVTNTGRKYFKGLPITSMALILPMFYGVFGVENPSCYTALLLLVAIAFISPIKVVKPRLREMLILSALGLFTLFFIL